MTLEPQTWYCKNCPITNDDCVEYLEDLDYFNKIKIIHNNHEGWQKGKPEPKNKSTEIEKTFTEKAVELSNEGVFDVEKLKQSLRDEKYSSLPIENNIIDSSDELSEELREEIRPDILEYIIQVCGKEIKEEDSNIKQITLTFFSSYTNNPMNLRILAPSGEGGYQIKKIGP